MDITWNRYEQVSISVDYLLMRACLSFFFFFVIHFYQNVAAFTTAAKSRNPFDNEEDSRPGQGAMVCAATNFIKLYSS